MTALPSAGPGPAAVQPYDGPSAPPPAAHDTARFRSRGGGVVAALAVAVAAPLIGLLVGLVRGGWAPTGDEAVIAWRSWDVFAGPSPLLGQFTQASASSPTPVYDPGPLLYWVLAVPEHLFPRVGAAVGSLGWSAVCLVVAVVAAGRAGGARAAGAAAGGLLLVAWSVAGAAGESPVWNPYAALLPFAALLVLTVVVLGGRPGWVPAVALLASFVAQAHLMYAGAAAGLLLLAVVVGTVDLRRRPGRQQLEVLVAAVAVLGACWWPAVVQQLTAGQGNLSALLDAVLAGGPTVGWRQAAGALGDALGPWPAWLRPDPGLRLPSAPPSTAAVVTGALALLAVTGVLLASAMHRRRGVAALAATALVAGLGTCWAVAGIGVSTGGSYAYIRYGLWPVSLLVEATLAAGLVSLVPSHGGRVARRAVGGRRPMAAGLAVLLVGAFVLTVGAGMSAAHRAGLGADRPRGAGVAMADRLAALVGPPLSPGRRLVVGVAEPGGLGTVALMTATGYRLRTEGWVPALLPPWSQVLDPRYARRDGDDVLGVGPVPPGARVLGAVDVPVLATGTSPTPLLHSPVWLLTGATSAG